MEREKKMVNKARGPYREERCTVKRSLILGSSSVAVMVDAMVDALVD